MTQPQGGDQFSLGNAVGYVDIDTSRATTALNGLRGTVQSFTQSTTSAFQNMGQLATNFGQSLSIAMIPVAGAMATGIQAAGNFQDALAEIEGRTGATAEAMERVRAEALRLGADTSFSAQQAADAFLMLLTAGISLDDVLKKDADGVTLLDNVLAGAAASGADLGLTAEHVTNIMASFGLEVTESARIVEVMNQAAGASPAEMSEMGDALKEVGGDARSFGLSLEQTGAILTIFARNGKKGTEAATQLRSILTQMTSTTTDSAKAWDMVGSSLFDANGNSRDFGVVLAEVKAGLEGLNAEDQAFVIQQLAGSYGRVGFNALLASEGIDAVVAEMGQQSSAAEVAEARLNTFNGIVESLKGSIESLLITAFTPFIDSLKPGLKLQTQWVNGLTTWVSANQRLVQPLLHLLKILTFVGPALIIIGKVLPIVGMGFAALFSPIGALTVAIALLSAAWAKNLGNIQYWTQATFTFIRDIFVFKILPIFNPVREAIENAVASFASFSKMGRSHLDAFGYAVMVFANTLGVPVSALLKFRKTFFNVLEGIQSRLAPVMRVFESLHLGWRILLTNLRFGNSILRSVIQAWTIFATSLGMSWETVLRVNKSIFGFRDAFIAVFRSISTTAANAVQYVTGVFKAIGSVIQGQIENFKSGGLRAVFDTLFDYADRRGSGFDILMAMGFSDETMSRIDRFLQPIAKAIDNFLVGVKSAYNSITAPIRNAMASFTASLNAGRTHLQAIGYSIIAFASSLGVPAPILLTITESIAFFFRRLDEGQPILKALGRTLWEFGLPFEPLVYAVDQFLISIQTTFRNTVNIFRYATSYGATRLEALGYAFSYLAERIGLPVEAFYHFRDVVTSTIRRVVNAVVPLFREIQTFLSNLFGNADASQLTSLIQPVWEVGHVLLQLTNPIGQISLLLKALGIDIFPMLMSAFESGVGILTTFFQYMNNGVAPVEALKAALGNPQWLDSVIAGFASIGNFVTGTVLPALGQLRDWFLASALPGIVSFVTTTVVPAIQNFFGILAGAWAQIQPNLGPMGNWLVTFGQQLFTVFGQVAKLLIDFAMVAIPIVAQALTTVIIPAISTFIGWVQNIWTAVAPYLTQFFDWFMNTGLPIALGYAKSLYDNVLAPLWNGIRNFIDTVVMPALERFGQWFIAGALQQIETAITVFVMQWDAFKQGIAAIWDFVSPALTSIWNWFTTGGLQEIGTAISGFLSLTWDVLKNAISGVWTFIQPGIDAFKNGITNALNAIITVINTVRTAWDNLRNAISTGIASARNDISNMQNAIATGGVGGAINQGASNIGQAFGTIGGAISSLWRDSGGPGIAGNPYLIGKGAQPELFVPQTNGTFIPNADKMMGGVNINGAITINANSYAEGAAAARGFAEQLQELMRST
jgi:TP901 family phage tail tape measure protein